MGSVCVLTDSSAQIPQPSFPGQELVRVLPLDVELEGEIYGEGKNRKASSLPPSADQRLRPRLIPPSVEKLRQVFIHLGQSYNEIIAVLLSSELSPVYSNALQAADSLRGVVSVQIIDSQTLSVGQGTLVRAAAEAASHGASATEIDRLVRSLIPHVYTVLCTPSLTYLHYAGYLDHAQATVSEMLGLFPIFALEEGKLTPLEKVRNHRGVLDFLLEFMEEFDHLQQIAILQSSPALSQETRTLREQAEESFPGTPFSEHTINLPLATLFGPRCMGMFLVEALHQKKAH